MELLKEYDAIEGALAYIAVAGGTDALSGTASWNTYRPVISCPPDAPNGSCLTNPPGSSNVYVAKPDNAARFLAQMFSAVNPSYKEMIRLKNANKVDELLKQDAELRGF